MKINLPDPFFLLFRVWHGFFFLPDPQELILRFFFPLAMAFFGSHKSFSLLWTRSRLTSSSILPLTRKTPKTGHLSNCKNISSARLGKNCTWQAEKTAGAFCAGCPYISLFKVLFFLQTSFLSALWLSALPPRQVLISCSSSLLLLICSLHCRHAKSKNDPLFPIRAHSLRSALHIEGRHAGIYRSIAQLLLDAQKLVVFCHTLGSARCAGLDLAGV